MISAFTTRSVLVLATAVTGISVLVAQASASGTNAPILRDGSGRHRAPFTRAHRGIVSESVLHSFGIGSDASNPFHGSLLNVGGLFYGTTIYGGSSGLGAVYTIDTSGNETVLHSFAG